MQRVHEIEYNFMLRLNIEITYGYFSVTRLEVQDINIHFISFF